MFNMKNFEVLSFEEIVKSVKAFRVYLTGEGTSDELKSELNEQGFHIINSYQRNKNFTVDLTWKEADEYFNGLFQWHSTLEQEDIVSVDEEISSKIIDAIYKGDIDFAYNLAEKEGINVNVYIRESNKLYVFRPKENVLLITNRFGDPQNIINGHEFKYKYETREEYKTQLNLLKELTESIDKSCTYRCSGNKCISSSI